MGIAQTGSTDNPMDDILTTTQVATTTVILEKVSKLENVVEIMGIVGVVPPLLRQSGPTDVEGPTVDIPIVVVQATALATLEDVVSISELEYHTKVQGFEGAPPPVSPQSGPKLPLEVGFGSGMVSHARDHEMITTRAESKGAMVLYHSDGDVREYWLGSCSKLSSPLGSNEEFQEAPNSLNSVHPIETQASKWVIHKNKEIQCCVGIVCNGFGDQILPYLQLLRMDKDRLAWMVSSTQPRKELGSSNNFTGQLMMGRVKGIQTVGEQREGQRKLYNEVKNHFLECKRLNEKEKSLTIQNQL